MEMQNVLRDAKLAYSERPEDCSFQQVYGMSIWEWLSLPENNQARKNFDLSMSTHAVLYPSDAIVKGE
jgi:hypothetical protein